jgi:hypothetical protein
VLHAIADHYLDVTTRIESDIDEMETQVFAPRSQVSAKQIYFMKREVLELRRAVMPLKTPLQRLAEGYTPLVPDEVRSYFRDVDDHLATVSERVVNFDELLTTLVDAKRGPCRRGRSTPGRTGSSGLVASIEAAHVPHPHRVVQARSCQDSSIGAERHAADDAGLAERLTELPVAGHIPQPHDRVSADDGQGAAVRAERHQPGGAGVAGERRVELPVARYVPQPESSVLG